VFALRDWQLFSAMQKISKSVGCSVARIDLNLMPAPSTSGATKASKSSHNSNAT